MLLNINEIQKKIDALTLQAGLPRHSVNLCSAPLVMALHMLHLKTMYIITFIQKEVMNFRGRLLGR